MSKVSPVTEQTLALAGITKYYGAKLILDHVSLLINRRDRIGLVGENGTGKTTLANIIMGVVAPDEGHIQAPPQIGYLPQEAAADEAMTIQQFLERSMGRLDELRATLETLEQDMAQPGLAAERLTELLDSYGPLQEEYARRGGYEGDYRLDQVLAGLALKPIDRQRPIQTLSGGEKTRVMLASLLLSSPDLLILDEPTNHLDFTAIEWLEDYLLTYEGAVLVISHDRRFLNRVISQIVELSPQTRQLTVYHGNYDFYIAEREREHAKRIVAYEEQQEEIKQLQQFIKAKTHAAAAPKAPKDNDKFLYDFKGGNVERTKAREIGVAKRRLEEIQDNPLPHPVKRWHIKPDFVPEEFSSREAIRLLDISKSFGGRMLLNGATATVGGGERVVLFGPNGIGKTTILKMIMGLETPDAGQIKIASGAKIGYLDQEQESLDADQTVIDAYAEGLVGTSEEHRANLHKYGLFASDQVFQKIGSLSIGQRRRLQIARLIASRANVLLLDEPTNHLDLESVEQFERALVEFPGTILAISHDRTFIERVATVTWEIRDGALLAARR